MPKLKKRTSTTHVFSSSFDALCASFGPDVEANKRIAKTLCRSSRSIRDWRSGAEACPKWAYELLRLTKKESDELFQHMFGKARRFRTSHVIGMTYLSTALDAEFGTASANDGFALPGQIPAVFGGDSGLRN